MNAPRPAKADRPPRGSRKVAEPHFLESTVLTHWYSGFLRRRRVLKHFGRHPLLNTVAGRGPTPAAPEPLARDLLLVARDDPAAAIARLKSHEDGLSAREAANVLRRKVAVRLRAGVRASDVVASLGEDSFSVLLAAMLAASDAQHVGAKLLASLTTPFKVAGQDVALAASLGIAQYPQDGRQPQALLNRAVGLAASGEAQGRAGFANFTESGGIGPAAANDD